MSNTILPETAGRERQFNSEAENLRRLLEGVTVGHEGLQLAQEMLEGSGLLGTNLTVEVGKKIKNPTIFSVDFNAVTDPDARPFEDGPRHTGNAQIFIPSEGLRPLLGTDEEGRSVGFINVLVRQMLKLHKKGIVANVTGSAETKAGKLSLEADVLLTDAENALVEELVGYVLDPRKVVSSRNSEAVTRWLESEHGATISEGQLVIDEFRARMGEVLRELAELANAPMTDGQES